MKKLFRAKGRLFWLENAERERVSGVLAEGRPVLVDVGYELRPSPYQPLRVDIHGRDLVGLGQTRDRLELDNGVVLTGRTYGGGFGGGEVRRIRLLDVEEPKIELYTTRTLSSSVDVDAVVFGVVSSRPLGHGASANGVARPGFPFSFRTRFPKALKTNWSTAALRLHHERLEITLVGTTSYWRKFIDTRTLQHDSIIGVRRLNGDLLKWDEINQVTSLLSNFLGWINHCRSPVFHIKGYRKGKLVYKGFDLHPHATVRRDEFSWLPMFGPKDGDRTQANPVQNLLDCFWRAWVRNVENRGVFHIALDMLRSRSKGSPRDSAAIGYLRDTFGACSILVGMLIGPSGNRTRRDVIWSCLKEIGVDDRLPIETQDDRDYVLEHCPELWWGTKRGEILEDEKGTLSRPLANVENWLLHIDDPRNAKMLLGLPGSVQRYLVEVCAWLADLMVLKVVGFQGWYFNRLTRQTELVPWAKWRAGKASFAKESEEERADVLVRNMAGRNER